MRRRYTGDMEAINRYVDKLQMDFPNRGPLPYVSPHHGGTTARMLSLLSSPGVDVQGESRTQLLSTQNSSAAATYVAEQLARTGIPESDVLPWNAYPWFKGSGTSKIEPSEMLYGEHALRGLLMLTPKLKVVVVQGRGAPVEVWRRVAKLKAARALDLTVIETYSPGPGALQRCSQREAQRRDSDRRRAFDFAASILNYSA